MKEVWFWSTHEEYYSAFWGDADRLPNGNRLGTFGHYTHPAYLIEVNNQGEIVWQYSLNKSSEYKYGIYRAERFYTQPIVELYQDGYSITKEGNISFKFNTWNAYRTRYFSDAEFRVFQDNHLIKNEKFQFLPHWQNNTVNVIIPKLNKGIYNFTLEIENSDAQIKIISIIVNINAGLYSLLGIGISLGLTITILLLIIILQFKKKK